MKSGILALMLLGSVNALADSSSVRIHATVAVICRATPLAATPIYLSDGSVDLGSFKDFCNNSAGYDIYAVHSVGAQAAILYFDGRAIPLSPSGRTRIYSSASPQVGEHRIAVDPRGDGQQYIQINLIAEPRH